MSKPVIPPFAPASPSGQTIEVLEHRLQAAECDTRDLIHRLNEMGFSREVSADARNEDEGPMEPFKARLADAELLHTNYEALVSRVCRTESAIQTLKLSLLNIQGDKDLKKKIYAQVEEKWSAAKQTYESQLSYLKREVRGLQDELTSECETRTRLKDEVKKLQKSLDEATTARAEASVTAEEIATSKQKLIRRVAEMKEELSMESSLRSSLEDSHNTLLGRIREMETVVESERTEVYNLTTTCKSLKTEVMRLSDELGKEQKMRGQLDERCSELTHLREKLQYQYDIAEAERQVAATELSRFQSQYQELISQVEKTQTLIDQNKMRCQELECDNQRLGSQLDTTSSELERLRTIHKREVQVEKTHVEERLALEEEAVKLRSRTRDTHAENEDMKKKIELLEKEMSSTKGEMMKKDVEFSQAAECLERELNSLRTQLHSMQDEKQNILRDKENLLEEVNQTVDTLMEERVVLQTDLEETKVELDTLYGTQRQLEREKADLLERLAGYEQQQMSHKKVHSTLKEMMEQKNKLAYENGRLQSQIHQLKDDLDLATRGQLDAGHIKKLNQALQEKYSSAQKEVSELKVAIQCLENQHRLSQELIQHKDQQLQTVTYTREQLEKDVSKLGAHVQAMDDRNKHKGVSYHKNLESAKTVNREITSTLEAVMASHSQLQTLVESLQVELGKRDTQITQLRSQKNKDQEEMRLEMKNFESKMSSLREELRKERDKSLKKNSKELGEIKKQNESLSSRNMELVRTNTELRHRVNESDRTHTELSQKLVDQRRKTEYLNKAKKQLEENLAKMKSVRQDIDQLEHMRDEYIKRNETQGETIHLFMSQIASLQEEIGQLAMAQANTSQLLQQKEAALEKEKHIRDDIKKKYYETRKREEAVSRRKKDAEGKLKDAHSESLEISQHLQEAHEWFKTKFDKLQIELDMSKKTQAKLEEANAAQREQLESERYHAQEAAEKAKDMIKASRETISRLADYADQAETDTKQQMAKLKAEARTERDVNKYVELRHQKYKKANDSYLDELMMLLDSTSAEGDVGWLA
ncbi:coiled-coil domain-containing protein 150-like [Haliotis cracherodii]|uniref:coiled-coil domain-containing protein 150-like n=1 Tax=Haliotis cracherodii TaxID=6455 RepID=UPI0039E9589A